MNIRATMFICEFSGYFIVGDDQCCILNGRLFFFNWLFTNPKCEIVVVFGVEKKNRSDQIEHSIHNAQIKQKQIKKSQLFVLLQ